MEGKSGSVNGREGRGASHVGACMMEKLRLSRVVPTQNGKVRKG